MANSTAGKRNGHKNRKNLKMRRAVRKTVAAIIMIMAVIVAAIPVEQLGTMQAQTQTRAITDIPLDTMYKTYAEYMEQNPDTENKLVEEGVGIPVTAYEEGDIANSSTYDFKTVKITESGNGLLLDWQFLTKYKKGSTDKRQTVIVKYSGNGNFGDHVAVDEKLYTEYFMIMQEHIDKTIEGLKNETYTIEYKDDTSKSTEYTIPASTATDDKAKKVTLKKLVTTPTDISSYISVDLGEIAKRKCRIESSETERHEFKADEILREFKSGDMSNHTSEVANYNSRIDKLIERITNAAAEGAPIDPVLYKELTDEAAELENMYSTCRTLSSSFQELQNSDSFIKFCLENRFKFNEGNATVSLDGFELRTPQGDAVGEGKYIPKWIKQGKGATPSEDLSKVDGDSHRAQFLDSLGYIGLDSVAAVGIGNKAFYKCEYFYTIGLPSTVQFIGNDAFYGCTNLKSISLQNVMAVGNRAFKECIALDDVVFTTNEATSKIRVLGAETFYNANLSKGIVFPTTIQAIGRGCFAKSRLPKFKIQQENNNNNVDIWPFAFYDCAELGDTGDGTTDASFFPDKGFKPITIGMGAFAVTSDKGKMKTFNFPNSMEEILAGGSDPFKIEAALELLFTDNDKTITKEASYDYILAGRRALDRVIFPYNLGTTKETKVPDNTLKGCENLSCAVFGELSLGGTNGSTTYDVWAPEGKKVSDYDTDEDGEVLFQDITNANFYVEGPGFINMSNKANKAKPRTITANAETKVSKNVPYMFLISDNPPEVRIELSHGDEHECLAILEVISEDTVPKTVRLVKYTYNGTGNEPIKDLVIKSMIGEYRLVELGQGCFQEVKDRVLKLTVEDGSVETIEANAFSNSTTLQQVTLGNSVKRIGDNSFAGCKELENVYFSSPRTVTSLNDSSDESEWAAFMTLGDGAFRTGSEYLTFHGDIHSGYAPFELAMKGQPFGSSASNRTICYKTDAPQNLTVLYDHQDKQSTLIDYPHYEELDELNEELKNSVAQRKKINPQDYSMEKNFEAYHEWRTVSFPVSSPEPDEAAVIAATYNVELPNGIRSVDAKRYIKYSANADNLKYLYLNYREEEDTGKIIRDKNFLRKLNGGADDILNLYSKDDATSGSDVAKAGLFSGYFREEDAGIVPAFGKSKTFEGKEVRHEEETPGNDQLLNIALNTVESLPDYAFDSCENLDSVGFGTKLAKLGKAPFRGCKSLTNVDTSSAGNENPYFTSENGIIYHLPQTGGANEDMGTGYVIEQCLMTRGGLAGVKAVNATTDSRLSQVSGIKPEAFSYCPDIQTVDLSDTTVTVIPEGCFQGDKKLTEVILPESVSRIDSKAFSDASPKVTIYSTTCQIESDAFDNGSGIIRGYKYTDGTNTKYSTTYQYAQNHNIQFEEITARYMLQFLDYDGSLIETQQVDAGKDGVEPNWTSKRPGYTFKEWSWEKKTDKGMQIVTGDKAYRNVNENRTILATYTVGSGVVSDGYDYTLTIDGGKNIAGSTKLTLKGGTAVTVIADAKSGYTFQYWSTDDNNKYKDMFEDIHTNVTTFIMPNADVKVIANFMKGGPGDGGSGGNNGGGSGSGDNGDSGTKYKLTVNYGSGSGEYKAGETVTISAYAPESSSKVFSKWTTTNTGVGFANAASASTTIVMPSSAVTVTANYKTRVSDDEDDADDDAWNNRHPSGSTGTVTQNPNNSSVSTSTSTGTVTNQPSSATKGDSITINKDGFSNKDVASTIVEGAADNFVVKVSESSQAVEEAMKALTDKYGSLDGILYFPMDISLYDATGRNKIADTTGLNVSVMLPIPDELIQYGGNVRVAAIESGKLRDLNVRFTTVDGISCMSFVPPHFSPYVIYVDTNNLVAGQMLDATPKTGDPIHPKWFLAAGMGCLSILLFTMGDKKKKVKTA